MLDTKRAMKASKTTPKQKSIHQITEGWGDDEPGENTVVLLPVQRNLKTPPKESDSRYYF